MEDPQADSVLKPDVDKIEVQRHPSRDWRKPKDPAMVEATDNRTWTLAGETPTPQAKLT